jgi:hypothetical protein
MSQSQRSPLDRWVAVLLAIWLATAIWLVWTRWAAIHWFALADTDDNMRIAQVRAWLAGQDWYDLRQMKLNPPDGFNIHWSRLVDLPIAAVIVALKPIVGGKLAEQVAVALAPLLPLGVVFVALGAAARRLVGPYAYLLAAALLVCCQVTLGMFMPLRIDHHGWQLAFLAVTIAGLADPERVRGGLTVGIASALSLVIGLELLPFIAVAGATIGLRWIGHREAAPRLLAYALSFGLATIIGYVLFASYANHVARCDALTPVWLTTIIVGCSALAILALVPAEQWPTRLALILFAGAATAAFFWLQWPQCRGRPEGVSPELYKLWLANVREAKPIHVQEPATILATMAIPVIGLVGALFGIWRARRTEAVYPWLSLVVMTLFAVGMLFWQIRAGPAAQLIGVTGAVALGAALMQRFQRSGNMLVRVFGVVGTVLVVSGLATYVLLPLFPGKKPTAYTQRVAKANRTCPTLPALAPIAKLPPATIMTFVDLGPRLITVTHHRAIAGPYHRNGDAILDIHHAFDGQPDQARAIAQRHGATLLLVCPNMNESTNYRSRSPNGFYARLDRGERFDWLEPMALPKGSPYRLWRIR